MTAFAAGQKRARVCIPRTPRTATLSSVLQNISPLSHFILSVQTTRSMGRPKHVEEPLDPTAWMINSKLHLFAHMWTKWYIVSQAFTTDDVSEFVLLHQKEVLYMCMVSFQCRTCVSSLALVSSFDSCISISSP